MRRALLLCAIAAALQGLVGCRTCGPWLGEPFGPYTGCDPANCGATCGGSCARGGDIYMGDCGPRGPLRARLRGTCDTCEMVSDCDTCGTCDTCEMVSDCGGCGVCDICQSGGYSPYGPAYAAYGPAGLLRFLGRTLGLSWPCAGCSSDIYWGDYNGYPPDCNDPCDTCGSWTGRAGEAVVDHPYADVPRGYYPSRGSSVASARGGLLVGRSASSSREAQAVAYAEPAVQESAHSVRTTRSAGGSMQGLTSGPMPTPPHSDVYPPKLISVTDEVVQPATSSQAEGETEVAQSSTAPRTVARPVVKRTSATQRRVVE